MPLSAIVDDEVKLMAELDRKYKSNPPKMMDWFSYKGEDVTSGACE